MNFRNQHPTPGLYDSTEEVLEKTKQAEETKPKPKTESDQKRFQQNISNILL